ncbi:igE-binding protein-like, partial [Cynocephalus volans]|uniref:igE-binding protein-like n=1 Tax=Cynocephalus volans TaxID=110931 RepID=UPI002FC843F7
LSDKVRKKVQAAFPVFEVEGGGRVHAHVEYTQIKDLAEAVRKYGVNANFTLVMLERFAGVAMTPADWQMLAKAALPTMGQYMEWKALWHEAAQAQARANAAALTPEQRDWTFDMLTGQGPFAADQTAYPWGAYVQVSNTAIKAWKTLPRKGETSGLTKIIQGPQEPFSDFVAQMTEAAGRIFGDPDQAAPLVEQLIFEQATQECWTAIAPRKDIKGRLLPPLTEQRQESPKNGGKGPRSQGPQKYGNKTNRGQGEREESLSEDTQDWTCTPPPTSY